MFRIFNPDGDVAFKCNSCGSECFGVPDESRDMVGMVSVYCPKCSKLVNWYTNYVDSPPDSCYQCPNATWENEYKHCNALDAWLHPHFNAKARLKDCPLVRSK